jgi:hypothetical protein
MSLARALFALVGAGILGIASVGHGAEATFTDATTSLQTITAGSPSASSGGTSGTLSSELKTLTVPTPGPVGPALAANNSTITVSNAALSP